MIADPAGQKNQKQVFLNVKNRIRSSRKPNFKEEMHRSTEPYCQCFDQATALSVCVRSHSCSAETEEDVSDSFRPTDAPLITKPTLIRMTRGHRNWMTHLPLSRPHDCTTLY